MRKVLNVGNGVLVRDGDLIKGAVIPAGFPGAIAFRDHVDRRGPIVFLEAADSCIQHILEFCFCDLQFLWIQFGSDGWAFC